MILITLAQQVGLNPERVASTEGGEFHSRCPSCSGKDRFIIWPNVRATKCYGRYWCRQCGISGDTIQFGVDFLGQDYWTSLETAQADTSHTVLSVQDKPISLNNYKVLEMPSGQWIACASQLVAQAHDSLLLEQSILMKLEKRGLPIDAVKKYKIGYIKEDIRLPAEKGEKSIWIPQGILIPTLDVNQVVRIKVRRDRWFLHDDLPKYVAIAGSMKGLNIIGNKQCPMIIVVESELDAYAMHYALSDIACVIAVGGASKRPDIVTDNLAQKKIILVCYDNDDAGLAMLAKWQEFYPHAQRYPTPLGKDIGEAIEQGLKIRPWILQYKWQGHEDQELVNVVLNYTNGRGEAWYRDLEKKILLGPDSSKAITPDELRFVEAAFKESLFRCKLLPNN